MRELVSKVRADMNKYRRGDDYERFKFTTSIYPQEIAGRSESLHNALAEAARARYPAMGVLCVGRNLVITNRTRERINEEVILWLAPTNHVCVKGIAIRTTTRRKPSSGHEDLGRHCHYGKGKRRHAHNQQCR